MYQVEKRLKLLIILRNSKYHKQFLSLNKLFISSSDLFLLFKKKKNRSSTKTLGKAETRRNRDIK